MPRSTPTILRSLPVRGPNSPPRDNRARDGEPALEAAQPTRGDYAIVTMPSSMQAGTGRERRPQRGGAVLADARPLGLQHEPNR